MDFGQLEAFWAYIVTFNNLLIMVGCGSLTEAFKRGPKLKNLARTSWGKALVYYLPFGWAWLFVLAPFGLAPDKSALGEKLMLGLILGGITAVVFGLFNGMYKHVFKVLFNRLSGKTSNEAGGASDTKPSA